MNYCFYDFNVYTMLLFLICMNMNKVEKNPNLSISKIMNFMVQDYSKELFKLKL